MARKKIVAGNWKMNLDFQSGIKLAKKVRARAKCSTDKLVILAPPAIHLKAVADLLSDSKYVSCAAQNRHAAEGGAYTGEISVPMLKSIKVDYVILGHSERRAYFGENAETLKAKVNQVLAYGLKPIFCCGESLAIRQSGTQNEYVANQIAQSLFHLSPKEFSNLVIAYEPIWAIGTGVTASPEQAQAMHKALRKLIATKYTKSIADNCTILYGGSVKPQNANELFSQSDVDGGLVGGASLKSDDFCKIASAM